MEISMTLDGARHQIDKIGFAEMVAFERHFGLPAASFADEHSVRLEWIAFLAYAALRKRGVIDRETAFDDEFIGRIDSIDVEGEEEAENPPI